jgi:hypothetical protein
MICLRWLRDNRCRTTQRLLRHGARLETVDSVWRVEIATESKNQRFTERHRQVLEFLAIALHGRDVNALLTLGFKLETMADLVRSELATVRIETVEKLDSKIEVALVQITDAGWQLLEGLRTRGRPPRLPNGQ